MYIYLDTQINCQVNTIRMNKTIGEVPPDLFHTMWMQEKRIFRLIIQVNKVEHQLQEKQVVNIVGILLLDIWKIDFVDPKSRFPSTIFHKGNFLKLKGVVLPHPPFSACQCSLTALLTFNFFLSDNGFRNNEKIVDARLNAAHGRRRGQGKAHEKWNWLSFN